MNSYGWIIYNGNLKSEKFIDYAQMLQTAANNFGSTADIIKNNELLSYLSTIELNLIPNKNLPDYVVFTDKDNYLARQLELLGVPVFNKAEAIAISDDKIATYQRLAQKNIPIPTTIIAPKIFITGEIDDALLQHAITRLGLPLVLKEAFGSFGEQVYLVHSKEELKEKIIQIGNKPYVFQQFIESSYGVDIRLQVVGSQVIAAMKRTSENDFRANVTAGSKMEAYEPTEEEKSLAIAATKAIEADFAGVDLLFGPDGPVVCEVNSNAHIRNLLESTKINAADFIMDYILKRRKSRKRR